MQEERRWAEDEQRTRRKVVAITGDVSAETEGGQLPPWV